MHLYIYSCVYLYIYSCIYLLIHLYQHLFIYLCISFFLSFFLSFFILMSGLVLHDILERSFKSAFNREMGLYDAQSSGILPFFKISETCTSLKSKMPFLKESLNIFKGGQSISCGTLCRIHY